MKEPLLSLVIPAFNEEKRICGTLDKVTQYLKHQPYTWEIIVVDDGSLDNTAQQIDNWAKNSAFNQNLRIQTIPHAGKGWAIKHGMLAAKGQYRFMCDADLAMPISQLDAFLDKLREGFDIVIGSRELLGAKRYGESTGRHFRGRVFNWLVRLIAVGGFNDTQCGFKCFCSKAAEKLFGIQETRGFGFDVEILYLAKQMEFKIIEIPIEWHHQERSTVRPVLDSFLMLRDAVNVRLRRSPKNLKKDS